MKTLVFFLLTAAPALAEGPLYHYKDATTQKEFENVYQDLRSTSGRYIQNTNSLQSGATFYVSSGTVSTLLVTGHLIGKGTTANDSAASGYIGEVVRSAVQTPVSSSGTGQFTDITSITLSAGDWDVTGQVINTLNGATGVTVYIAAITSTSGNSTTGQIDGDNRLPGAIATSGNDSGITIASYRVSLGATTTYYLKWRNDFSAGTPKAYGRISARRMR